MPDLVSLHSRYNSQGLVVLGVCASPASTQNAYARSSRLSYPLLVANSSLPAPYNGVTTRPAQIVIDRRGVVRETMCGYQPGAIERRVTPLLAQR